MAKRVRTQLNRAVPQASSDRRPNANRRGYDKEWAKVRNEFIDENPFCNKCQAAAKMVDHIIPIYVRWDLRLDKSNLQSLCWSCHNVKTMEDLKNYGPPRWPSSVGVRRKRRRYQPAPAAPPKRPPLTLDVVL